jgi:ligand-binding sensor domain-containing protein
MGAKAQLTLPGLLVILIGVFVSTVYANPDVEGYPPIYEHWESLTTKDGLPNDHIYWVEVDEVRQDRIWLGTDNGLACYHLDGTMEVYKPEDGLGHQAVMGVEVDPGTGDVWVATFGGLSWLSGGQIVKTFTQFNSGLANDVVYSVVMQGDTLWAATTAGTSCYIPRTGEWTIYSALNMPTDENWCYNVCSGDGKVFIAAWGGGIIEYDVATDHFRHYLDPDGEFEIDLFPHDGLVHNITTSPSYHDGLLWATTYFGLSVYDFRRWRGYFDHDSGLASNFINLGRAQPGTHNGWICTDKGLSVLNHDTNHWVTYKPNEEEQNEGHHEGGIIELWNGGELVETRKTKTGIAHKFVLSVDFQGEDVWVGTSHGLSHGIRKPEQMGMR